MQTPHPPPPAIIMPYARVGVMPQPNRQDDFYPPGRGTWRNRVQSGMTMEDLKRATSLRLANEQVEGQSDNGGVRDPSSPTVIGPDPPMQFQQNQHHQQYNYNDNLPQGVSSSSSGSRPHISQMPPNGNGFHVPPPVDLHGQSNQPSGGRDHSPYVTNSSSQDGSHSSHYDAYNNNYFPGGSGGGYGDLPLFPSTSPQPQNPQQTSSSSGASRPQTESQVGSNSSQQQYAHNQNQMRMHRHPAVLQDRRSFENVPVAGNGSDPNVLRGDISSYNSWGSANNGSVGGRGNGGNGKSTSPHSAGPKVKGKGGKGKQQQLQYNQQQPQPREQREMKSLEGRRTPVKDRNIEGQRILYATPNQRREPTPTSVYSEPPRNKMACRQNHNANTSPAYNMHLRLRTPDHSAYPKAPSNANPPNHYPKNAHHHMPIPGPGGLPGKQSKLPHGLTVQELKEMTRARLAAEAEQGGPEERGAIEDSALQHAESSSVGTQGSSKGSVRSGDQLHHQIQQQHQQFQSQAPHHGIRQQYSQHPNQHLQPGYSMQYRKNSSESVISARSGPANLSAPPSEYCLQPQYGQGQGIGHHGSQPQLHHMQSQQFPYPRQHSPSFGSGGQSRPYSPAFGGGQPRQQSPSFGSGPNQFSSNHHEQQVPRHHSKEWKPQATSDAWETASVVSTLASEYQGSEVAFPAPFAPTRDSSGMVFNRGRCFSAGAGIPSSSFEQYLFEQQQHSQAAYFEAQMSGSANRRRCATVSPPGMTRLYEDRPYPAHVKDKEHCPIPPLSEPRLRHAGHQSGFNGKAMSFQSLSLTPSPQPPSIGSGSAFEPIGKMNSNNPLNRPRSPPNLNAERSSKFGLVDRSQSTGSSASIHGDLPSSMAESVLESITGAQQQHPMDGVIEESPFEAIGRLNNDVTSGFRFGEESGNGSFFSGGPRSIFSHENSGGHNILGTNSWGGAESSLFDSNEENFDSGYLSHDFSSLLQICDDNGPAPRGRAATAPCFGENSQLSPLLVSRIDPELNRSRDPLFSQGLFGDMSGVLRGHSDNDGLSFDHHALSPLHHSNSAPVSQPPDGSSAVGDSTSFERASPSNHF